MRRSQRLDPVLAVARKRSRDGLQALAYVQHKLAEEQDRLEQLERCKAEYKSDKDSFSNQPVNVQTLQSFRQFKHNVEQAIEQQRRQIQAVEGQVSQVRSHWQQLDARSKSLEKTQQRIQVQEAAAESRLEDKNNEQLHALLRGQNS